MNEGQVKTRIFILKTLDWAVLIAVVSAAIYFILHSENSEMIGLGALAGLLVVSKLGDYTKQKIARLHVDLEIDQRQQRKNRH